MHDDGGGTAQVGVPVWLNVLVEALQVNWADPLLPFVLARVVVTPLFTEPELEAHEVPPTFHPNVWLVHAVAGGGAQVGEPTKL